MTFAYHPFTLKFQQIYDEILLSKNTMGDDDAQTVLSAKKDGPLPRCVCGWKLCRTYQRAFREVDHEIFHGVIKMKFSEYDETHRTLKYAWDQILGTDENYVLTANLTVRILSHPNWGNRELNQGILGKY